MMYVYFVQNFGFLFKIAFIFTSNELIHLKPLKLKATNYNTNKLNQLLQHLTNNHFYLSSSGISLRIQTKL